MLEELVHQPGHTEDRQVGVRAHRTPVPAEREDGDDAAVVVPEPGDDVTPQRTVHRDAVQQDDHRAVAAGVLVVDGSRREFHLGHDIPLALVTTALAAVAAPCGSARPDRPLLGLFGP
ncbi:hypothetical protein [Streptosporangium longisporum]|uniref:hypothetical protein n=1 Tax=Streptosporangium longisporum TaxID=46187 RepID=UPI0031EEF0A8